MLKSLQCIQTDVDSRLQNVEIYLFDKGVQVDLLCTILLLAGTVNTFPDYTSFCYVVKDDPPPGSNVSLEQ